MSRRVKDAPRPGASPALVRRVNEAAVLAVLRTAGPLTASDLAEQLASSRPTIDAVLGSLIEQGWVTEDVDGPRPVRQGRPARVYGFDAGLHHVAGLDLGGDRVRAVVADLDGRPVGEAMRSPRRSTARGLLDAAALATAAACARAGVEPDLLATVVAGTSGIVAPDGNRVLTADDAHRDVTAAGLPGGSRTARILANDVNLAAVAETWRGAAGGAGSLFEVLVGSRMGTGLVIAGRVHAGSRGAAGEIGTLGVVGWDAVHDLVVQRARDEGRSADEVVEDVVADVRDRLGQDLVEAVARAVAIGALVIDPDLVVVAGPSDPGPLVERIRAAVDALTDLPVRVVASEVGDDRVCLGAVRLALDELDRRLFQPDSLPVSGPIVLA